MLWSRSAKTSRKKKHFENRALYGIYRLCMQKFCQRGHGIHKEKGRCYDFLFLLLCACVRACVYVCVCVCVCVCATHQHHLLDSVIVQSQFLVLVRIYYLQEDVHGYKLEVTRSRVSSCCGRSMAFCLLPARISMHCGNRQSFKSSLPQEGGERKQQQITKMGLEACKNGP